MQTAVRWSAVSWEIPEHNLAKWQKDLLDVINYGYTRESFKRKQDEFNAGITAKMQHAAQHDEQTITLDGSEKSKKTARKPFQASRTRVR